VSIHSDKEIEVILKPDTYRGWKLVYAKSHDGQGDFRARRNNQHLFAPDLPDLMRKIDSAEAIAVEFATPIKALLEQYGISTVEIIRLMENTFEYLDTKGEVDQAYLCMIKRDGSGERNFYHDSKENRSIMRRITETDAKIHALYDRKTKLRKSMRTISVPWLLMEAKRQGAVKVNGGSKQ